MSPRRDRHAPRPATARPEQTASVRLTRKFADVIDGVDLREAKVGDRLTLSPRDAEVLVAEGWAEDMRATAADRSTPRKRRPTPKPR